MSRFTFVNGSVVARSGVIEAAGIAVEDGRIASIDAARATGETIDLQGGWLLPGFVDTQINGGGGVLLNNDVSVSAIATIAAAHARYGTTALLPTLISETPAMIAAALGAVDTAIEAGVPGVVGVHIEGPALNPARKGIHDDGRFRAIDAAMMDLLVRPRRGVVMVTLAPERTSPETIATLAAAGVRVSAGHSEADYATMIAAFDAGMTGVTHLFNAMPPMQQRAPGVVGAALDDPRPWCGLIVDGVHVHPAVLRVALRARPRDRMMLVTDAMSSVGMRDGAKDFVLQGRDIQVADGICRFQDGTLAGSDLDMAGAVANAVRDLGASVPHAAAMAAANPAAFLGLERDCGEIAVGLRADWVWLDSGLRPVATWIGGRRLGGDAA